jgi:hypothetical protein
VADENGNIDWAAPDEEVHALVNELEHPIGIYLHGSAWTRRCSPPEALNEPKRRIGAQCSRAQPREAADE